MITLVVTVALGLAFALIAVQNTQTANLNLWSYYLPNVPVYLIALIPLLLGLLASLIIHTLKDLSSTLTITKQSSDIKKTREENAELLNKNHKLEIENTKLKSKLGEDESDDNSI